MRIVVELLFFVFKGYRRVLLVLEIKRCTGFVVLFIFRYILFREFFGSRRVGEKLF